jgi:hypothetical protein
MTPLKRWVLAFGVMSAAIYGALIVLSGLVPSSAATPGLDVTRPDIASQLKAQALSLTSRTPGARF